MIRYPLELQSCFTRRIGQRFHAAVKPVAAAVEHHLGDARVDRLLRQRLPDDLRARRLVAAGLLEVGGCGNVRPCVSSITCA
jgi:hypothetical protein